ncbi:LamG-like jellyroll fold domain-containing protein [Amycolatopsis sp. lyj-23]|uniref:LamG-like jellyroll fold domain-containing protein n=1 Tax=Amycolatopsis sp. lyj-23 TaxID=2789283 RepID=UPI00397E0A28
MLIVGLAEQTGIASASVSTPQQPSGTAVGKSHQAPSALSAKQKGHAPGVAPGAPEAGPKLPVVTPQLSDSERTVPTAGDAGARTPDRKPRPTSEVVSGRTPTTKVFANDDGSFTARVYSTPVHYRTATGAWNDIDATLIRGGDGAWHEKANSSGVTFAMTADAPQLVSVPLTGGASIGFSLQDSAPAAGQPAGSAITYPSVRPHADLKYQATAVGAKETLVLHDATAPTSWSFPLHLTGVTAKLGADGRSVEFSDAAGRVVDTITNGFMEDAKVDPRSGDGAMSTGVAYALDTVNGQQVLRVSLDPAWLQDPARVFPVSVDPSVSNLNTASSTYVMSPYKNNYSSDAELKVGTFNGGNNVANSYLNFNVGAALGNNYIEAVTLDLDEIWSYSCSPRPVYVAPITSGWSVSSINQYPGLSYGGVIGSNSFAGGTSCGGPVWQSIDLGDNPSAAGTQLVESWAHGGGNLGLALYASGSDTYGWKRFDSVNSPYPPYLSITYSPYGADYQVANSYVQPTGTAAGSQQVTMTNRGTGTWTSPGTTLSYQLYTTGWQRVSVTAPKTSLPQSVGPNGTVTVNAAIGAVTPGQYYLCWDMQDGTTSFNAGYGVPTSTCSLINSANTPPQIDSANPPSNVVVGSLTPQLMATGHDPDNYPASGLDYDFVVYGPPAAGSTTPTTLAESGWAPTPNWSVPANKLAWNQSYSWTVKVGDHLGESAPSVPAYFSTAVPQPLITSHLGTAATAGTGRGFDAGVGDYTSTATDASVAVAGPALRITRSYNSLDPRTTSLFGSGWSTAYDMVATPDNDGSGNVVVTYPDGRTLRFGLNPDGTSFAPPQGTYATFSPVFAGGYTLTDRGGTTYTFGRQAGTNWQLTTVTDADGRTETLTYGTGGALSTITNTAGNRSLHLTWSGTHVSQVSTDPVTTGGTPLTWTYSYAGDTLTKVCPPTSTTQCTTYGYTSGSSAGSHYRSTVLDAQPYAYWRLNQSSTATTAVDEVTPNLGTLNGTSTATSSSTSTPHPGSPDSSTAFGGNASIRLPDNLVASATFLSIQLWFQTPVNGAAGVLLSTGHSPIGSANPSSGSMPMLYVGTDGKLYGQFWTGAVAPTVSAGKVNDGAWHQATLTGQGTTQSLYLDGALVGTKTGQLGNYDPEDFVGAGYVNTNAWINGPAAGWSHFTGNVAEVAFYTHALGAPAIAQQHAAGAAAAAELTSITSPNGKTAAQIQYDNIVDRATRVTDADGGSWTIGTPSSSGSSAQYRGAVLSVLPRNHWSLGESSGTQAANLMTAGNAHGDGYDPIGSEGNATYHNVTLGQPGMIAGATDTAAGFNGTSSWVALPPAVDGDFGLWFKTSTPGGVLLGCQSQAPGTSGTPADAHPMLYVGTDGKLYGEKWDGYYSPIASNAPVADGKWHFAALIYDETNEPSVQTLYVDGVPVGTRSKDYGGCAGGDTTYVGAGYIDSAWPAAPTANPQGNFTGSIANITNFGFWAPPTAATIKAMYDASHAAATSTTPFTTVTVTDPGSATLKSVYDPAGGGRLIASTDGLGNTTSYSYDVNGFRYRTTDPDGAYVQTTHDARGNVLSRTTGDTSTRLTATAYYTYPPAGTYPSTDPRDDLPTAFRNGNSADQNDTTYLTGYTYSAHGDPLTVTDPLGGQTASTYTAGTEPATRGGMQPAGLLATRTDPLHHVTSYSYDSAGDLTQVVLASGARTTYTYDNLGRRTGQTDFSDTFPAGTSTTYAYDGNSRLLSQLDPATTDGVTGKVHTRQTTLTYDPDGNTLTSTISDTTGGDAARATVDTYNSHNQLDSRTDPLNHHSTYSYDAYGNVSTTTDPSGNTYAYSYNANRQRLTTTLRSWTGDPNNPSSAADLVLDSRSYDPAGLLAVDTDAMGREHAYTYTARGAEATDTLSGPGDTATFFRFYDYDHAGALNEIDQGPKDNVLQTYYFHDEAGRLQELFRLTDSCSCHGSTTVDYTHDAAGNITKQSEVDGTTTYDTDYTYDALGDQTSQTVHNGAADLVTSWTYDQRGVPTSMTDPRGTGYTTNYTHDALGRLTTTTEPATSVEAGGGAPVQARPISQTGYDTFDEPTATSDPDGNITTNTYDTDGELLAVSSPAYTPPGTTTSLTPTSSRTYDALGNVLTSTDPLNHVTTNTYDQLSHLARTSLPPAGEAIPTWRYSHDLDGDLLSATDPTGARHEATYDAAGEQLTSTDVVRQPTTAAYTTQLTYGLNGRFLGLPTIVTQPGGQPTTYEYNRLGETTSETDPLQHKTTYDYDDLGRATRTTLPDGTATTKTYDPAGRHTGSAELDTSGNTLASTTATFDPAGNLATSTDPTGATTTYSHDARGRLTQRVDPVSAGSTITTSNGYDAAGHLTRATDGAGHATTFTYNSLGLLESKIAPHVAGYTTAADSTSTLTYDGAGRATAVSLPGGVGTSVTYDALGRVTAETGTGAQAPTPNRSFGYDDADRLTSVGAPSGNETFTYDDRGSVLTGTGPAGTSSFSYNSNGQLTARTDRAGTAAFTYDAAGQLATATDPQTGATATYGYNTVGQVTSIGYGTSSATQTNTYNDQHQLTGQTLIAPGGASEAAITYGRDSDGRTTSLTTTGTAGAASTNYGYDQSGRLTSATSGSTTTTYGYDGAGNRTQAGTATATYNERNQLVSAGPTTYTYTARGTLSSKTSGGTTTGYTYDAFGQLGTDGTNNYSYDSLGRMLTSGTNTFSYDGTTSALTGDGTDTYGRGPDGDLSSVSRGGHSALAFTNAHGDLTATFSASGTSLDGSTAFDPYGQPTAVSGNSYDLGFQGGWTSPTTGYVATASRWYNPASGGFTSQDTQLSLGGPAVTRNGYAYGDDDPLDNLDPSGNSSCGSRAKPKPKPKPQRPRQRGNGKSSAAPVSSSTAYPFSYSYGDGHEVWTPYDLPYRNAHSGVPAPAKGGYDEFEGTIPVWKNGTLVPGRGAFGANPFDDLLDMMFGGGGLALESADSCEEPTEPHRPTAEDGINEKPTNEKPSGQNTSPSQPGTKTNDSGPADEPVNTATEAGVNPAAADQAPFEGATQPGGTSSEPTAGGGRISDLSDDDQASIQNLRDAADRARDGTIDDIERTLTKPEFRQMERAFDKQRYWRVKQFFGKYMEKAVGRDPSVRGDQNITQLGRPFKAEPDFQVGKFNIDITTDTEYSERVHLSRDYIDSKENLLTYRRLTVPEMIELFGEA